MEQEKVTCGVCRKRIFFSEIEKHTELCLDNCVNKSESGKGPETDTENCTSEALVLPEANDEPTALKECQVDCTRADSSSSADSNQTHSNSQRDRASTSFQADSPGTERISGPERCKRVALKLVSSSSDVPTPSFKLKLSQNWTRRSVDPLSPRSSPRVLSIRACVSPRQASSKHFRRGVLPSSSGVQHTRQSSLGSRRTLLLRHGDEISEHSSTLKEKCKPGGCLPCCKFLTAHLL